MRAGSTVMIGENLGPKFRVVHIEDGMAWVRSKLHGDCVVKVTRLREVGSPYPSFGLRRFGAEL